MKQNLLIKMDEATFQSVGSDGPQLSQINFSIAEGQHTYILGNSGAGKSLFVKSAMGLIPLSTGEYSAFGRSMKDPDNLTLHYVRKKVGLLPEKGILIESLNIRENLAFPLKYMSQNKNEEHLKIVEQILQEHQLDYLGDMMPYQIGINAKKCIGLLRALIFDPPLLILDDPYEGLDEEGAGLFHRYFQNILEKRHTTILLLSRKPIRQEGVFLRFLAMDSNESFHPIGESHFITLPEALIT